MDDVRNRPGRAAGVAAIIAIPANNEAERIEACLAALTTQRDECGAPIAAGSFAILVYANNCIDDTAARAAAVAAESPHPIEVVVEHLPPERSNAGGARKRAMDLAADRLRRDDQTGGVILTTDADSVVGSTWFSATLHAFARGVDGVAGYIDGNPAETMRLGRGFVTRGRLEDRYLRAMAEIYAICDPRPHDPWPNHRVSSGASLAVTVSAYVAIGGLPPKPLGEDAALTQALENAGFRVRHAMDVCVSTSCRFDGRARGGAADTMRLRHEALDAPCDAEIEAALPMVRRALCKGRLRRIFDARSIADGRWAARFGVPTAMAHDLLDLHMHRGFEAFWADISEVSPMLRHRQALRPSDLPHQTERAETFLRLLRRPRAAPMSSQPWLRPAGSGREVTGVNGSHGPHRLDPASCPKAASIVTPNNDCVEGL